MQPTEERAREVGKRQSLSREVNERIEELSEDFELLDEMEIMCECGYDSCNERIVLSEAQYEALRRIPTHFAVLAGHEIPRVERVVERDSGFIVVEKIGASAIVAVKLDPRRTKQ